MMNPKPIAEDAAYIGSAKLKGKVAIITGGDSGIGRAVSIAYAKEGADVVIVHLNEHDDALETKARIEQLGHRCLVLAGDIGDEAFCQEVVKQTLQTFGKIDILVNNAGEQHPQNSILDVTTAQLERTFRTNIFSYFFLTKAALPHLKSGSVIINTSSITAYEGHDQLIDYSATKGAVVSFTRSLSESLCKLGIRVNGVAPGPIWTPLIPASFASGPCCDLWQYDPYETSRSTQRPSTNLCVFGFRGFLLYVRTDPTHQRRHYYQLIENTPTIGTYSVPVRGVFFIQLPVNILMRKN